jgi:hypothetical protein
MLHHHHQHRVHNRLRISCYCLNRDGGSTQSGNALAKWSRDHAHFCDIVHPTHSHADAVSHFQDEDIARHMNSLRPHIIVDLHGHMCAAAASLFHRCHIHLSIITCHFILPPLPPPTPHISFVCQARQPRPRVFTSTRSFSNSERRLCPWSNMLFLFLFLFLFLSPHDDMHIMMMMMMMMMISSSSSSSSDIQELGWVDGSSCCNFLACQLYHCCCCCCCCCCFRSTSYLRLQVIGDRVVSPADHAHLFTERIVMHPLSFFAPAAYSPPPVAAPAQLTLFEQFMTSCSEMQGGQEAAGKAFEFGTQNCTLRLLCCGSAAQLHRTSVPHVT